MARASPLVNQPVPATGVDVDSVPETTARGRMSSPSRRLSDRLVDPDSTRVRPQRYQVHGPSGELQDKRCNERMTNSKNECAHARQN